MKELILFLCGFIMCHQLMAQTFSEWFRQDHTQLKYLAEQIARLKIYDGILQQGYDIGGEGLDSIGSAADIDWEMHAGHLKRLDFPSKAIGEDGFIAGIQKYCDMLPILAQEIEFAYDRLPAGSPLNRPDMGITIAASLRQAAAAGREWLNSILTAVRYRMDDEERLNRLREIDKELTHIYGQGSLLLAEIDSSLANRWI